jgi:hypothetical protein
MASVSEPFWEIEPVANAELDPKNSAVAGSSAATARRIDEFFLFSSTISPFPLS